MWDFPTSQDILHTTDALAAVLTSKQVSHFLVSTTILPKLTVKGGYRVDAAAWIDGSRMLVSIVNLNYHQMGNITVQLPTDRPVKSVESTLWGETEWKVGWKGISTRRLPELGVSLLVLNL